MKRNGFETKTVVKRFLLTVSLSVYLFPVSTLGCAQSEAMLVSENVRSGAKRRNAVCREQK